MYHKSIVFLNEILIIRQLSWLLSTFTICKIIRKKIISAFIPNITSANQSLFWLIYLHVYCSVDRHLAMNSASVLVAVLNLWGTCMRNCSLLKASCWLLIQDEEQQLKPLFHCFVYHVHVLMGILSHVHLPHIPSFFKHEWHLF